MGLCGRQNRVLPGFLPEHTYLSACPIHPEIPQDAAGLGEPAKQRQNEARASGTRGGGWQNQTSHDIRWKCWPGRRGSQGWQREADGPGRVYRASSVCAKPQVWAWEVGRESQRPRSSMPHATGPPATFFPLSPPPHLPISINRLLFNTVAICVRWNARV